MAKRILTLALALCALLTGCKGKNAGVIGSTDLPAEGIVSTAQPTPSPTPSPTPDPGEEGGDLDRGDEADYYFDFGQDDLIRLNYRVDYPAEEMPGWQERQSDRVGALLTLQKGESTICVRMEDAPEYADLDAFMEYAAQMMLYTYEGVEPRADSAGSERLLTGDLPEGGVVQFRCRTVDGLYVTCELLARGESAQEDLAQFGEVFCPGLTFTYTEIDRLNGGAAEE